MIDTSPTLSWLAGVSVDASKSGVSHADREKLVAALRARAHEFPQLGPYDLGERLLGLLTESLRKPVASVLEEVWKQRKELREVAAGTRGHATAADVEMIDHSMTWTLKPAVTMTVNG